MPQLARDFQVVAVDQRGIWLSDKPPDGYDTGTLASDLVALMEGLGHQRFALVGFDTGVAIAYALAADHRDRVERLVVGEGPLPGVAPSPPLFLPGPLNERLWHIGFNRTAEVNERLVKGREDIYIGNEYAVAAAKPLPTTPSTTTSTSSDPTSTPCAAASDGTGRSMPPSRRRRSARLGG